MRMEIRTRNGLKSEAVETHVRRRLGNALDHLAHRISHAVVKISDVNGPRGGPDKRCQVRVHLHPRGTVIVSELDNNLYRAVDSVAGRLKKAVSRGLARQFPLR